MYKAGKGIKEIGIDEIVSKEKQVLIKKAAAKHGTSSPSVLIADLPKNISYGEIRMVLASVKT